MVAEKTVIINGARVPLSAIKPKESTEEEKSVETPTPPAGDPPAAPSKDINMVKLMARFDALKENPEGIQEMEEILESFRTVLGDKKLKKDMLLDIAELVVPQSCDEKMTKAQIIDTIILPMSQYVEERKEPEL